VIELILTCFVGSLVAGLVLTAWVLRSARPRPIHVAHREV
jgi:hypothetical protein